MQYELYGDLLEHMGMFELCMLSNILIYEVDRMRADSAMSDPLAFQEEKSFSNLPTDCKACKGTNILWLKVISTR